MVNDSVTIYLKVVDREPTGDTGTTTLFYGWYSFSIEIESVLGKLGWKLVNWVDVTLIRLIVSSNKECMNDSNDVISYKVEKKLEQNLNYCLF